MLGSVLLEADLTAELALGEGLQVPPGLQLVQSEQVLLLLNVGQEAQQVREMLRI